MYARNAEPKLRVFRNDLLVDGAGLEPAASALRRASDRRAKRLPKKGLLTATGGCVRCCVTACLCGFLHSPARRFDTKTATTKAATSPCRRARVSVLNGSAIRGTSICSAPSVERHEGGRWQLSANNAPTQQFGRGSKAFSERLAGEKQNPRTLGALVRWRIRPDATFGYGEGA